MSPWFWNISITVQSNHLKNKGQQRRLSALGNGPLKNCKKITKNNRGILHAHEYYISSWIKYNVRSTEKKRIRASVQMCVLTSKIFIIILIVVAVITPWTIYNRKPCITWRMRVTSNAFGRWSRLSIHSLDYTSCLFRYHVSGPLRSFILRFLPHALSSTDFGQIIPIPLLISLSHWCKLWSYTALLRNVGVSAEKIVKTVNQSATWWTGLKCTVN